jgi:hypothetical protein
VSKQSNDHIAKHPARSLQANISAVDLSKFDNYNHDRHDDPHELTAGEKESEGYEEGADDDSVLEDY